KQSQDATNEGRKHMKDLNADINSVVGVRTADVAYDLMDKIDRSMYERKSDVTAWARLRPVKELAENFSTEKQEEVSELLNEYIDVFDVYKDIIVTDAEGKVIAVGDNKEYIGKSYSNEEWFKRCMRQNDIFISDMYYSEKLKDYTMSFSCPIVNASGKKIGVLSSRLNWEAVYDIIDRAKIGVTGEVYVINKTGEVIASKNRMDILNRNLTDAYSAARDVISGKEYGYEIEEINGEITAIIGYAYTKGYKTYSGKEWSVVVKEVF
ncbi:MAG: cache domain-containing protein, partial [Clostridia bacterium]|nr:cache domain-containing protein [Clostridia bacterium]